MGSRSGRSGPLTGMRKCKKFKRLILVDPGVIVLRVSTVIGAESNPDQPHRQPKSTPRTRPSTSLQHLRCDQIAIDSARGSLHTQLPANSFTGGFRTTAPVQAASFVAGRHPKPFIRGDIPLGLRVRQLLPTTQWKFTGSPVRRQRWPCISNRVEQPARATFRRTPPMSAYRPISIRL